MSGIQRCILARDLWPKDMSAKDRAWNERKGVELATSIYRVALNSFAVTPSQALLAVYLSGLSHGAALSEKSREPQESKER